MTEEICIVRVATEAYERSGTYFYGKTLRVLKRLSNHDLLKDECNSVGISECLENITNLKEVDDGKYRLLACNFSTDYETGWTDGWALKLIKYEDEE